MKTNSLAAWILAVRPHSLGNAVILILVGSALAWTDGSFHWLPTLLCLVFALLMQCTANLVNDLWDYLKAPTNPTGWAPTAPSPRGYITLGAMKAGIAAFTVACVRRRLGILVWALRHDMLAWGGWELVAVGVACVIFAYFYTAGPWPLAYHGLGDVAVILFFGLVPVGFTYYVQTGTWTWETILTALACGLVIDTMLMVNNFPRPRGGCPLRKRTVVVFLGARFGKPELLRARSPGRGAVSDAAGRRPHIGRAAAARLSCRTYLHVAQTRPHRPRRRTEHLPRRDGPQHHALRALLTIGILLG